MRKLVYDCLYKNVRMKTVDTFKEAKAWKKEDARNTVEERLIDYVEKEETKEEREKRITRAKKRNEAIRKKASMVNKKHW